MKLEINPTKRANILESGHRVLLSITTKGFLFAMAALLAGIMAYGQVVSHKPMALSAALAAACLLGGILMTAVPDSRLVNISTSGFTAKCLFFLGNLVHLGGFRIPSTTFGPPYNFLSRSSLRKISSGQLQSGPSLPL